MYKKLVEYMYATSPEELPVALSMPWGGRIAGLRLELDNLGFGKKQFNHFHLDEIQKVAFGVVVFNFQKKCTRNKTTWNCPQHPLYIYIYI